MEKKLYIVPGIAVMQLVERDSVLAGSGDAPTVRLDPNGEEIKGAVDAKGFTSKDLWDED